jgi:hypothetical protein
MVVEKPEVAELLLEGEIPVEYTKRKPRQLLGAALAVVGIPTVMEPLIRQFVTVEFIMEFLVGLALVYFAVREFLVCTREFACVTNQRVLYRRVTWRGKPGRTKAVFLSDISSAKLCQTAMAWRNCYSGDVLMKFAKGGQYVTPFLENGQFILDAIREERANIAIAKHESSATTELVMECEDSPEGL